MEDADAEVKMARTDEDAAGKILDAKEIISRKRSLSCDGGLGRQPKAGR